MDHSLSAATCAEGAADETAAAETLAASRVGVRTLQNVPVLVCGTVEPGTNRQRAC